MRYPHTMVRRGFTLVELLVATGIFVIGFAAVFGLFLSGMRFRKLADDTTLTATLAASVLTEIYLDSSATAVPTGPVPPSDYIGDGQAPSAATDAPSGMTTKFFAYPAIPGAFYRIDNCTDLLNGQDPFATAINADVLTLCPGAKIDDYSDLNRRLRLLNAAQISASTDPALSFEDELVQHGVALRYKAVLIRQPHWLFKP